MVANVIIDKLTVLEAVERHGTLRRLVRQADVSGISSTNWDIIEDALDEAGVPQYGDHLTDQVSSTAYGLVLVERNVKVVDKDRAQVELVYENTVDLEQDLDAPYAGYTMGAVRCNIQQKQSNLDADGDQVEVSHTYPADDPNHPSETLTQGGEFDYYESQRTIHVQGIKTTRTPWLLANQIVGKVNDQAWSGELMRTWLCTACSWKPAGVSGDAVRYFMDFEFQHDADTWDPTVVFIDDVTGKPPANLVKNVGYKTVTKMETADFDRILGSPLQGG